MEKYDKIFNSSETKEQQYQLASGYISTTTVHFEEENIVAKIEANGVIEFFCGDDAESMALKMPEQTGGRQVYEDVICSVEENNILLNFPIVKWIDNYPHCDGEHDRWDSQTIGWHKLTFNTKTKEFSIETYDAK